MSDDIINVLVLSGGPSAERSVSLKSGEMVCEHLDPERYNVVPVEVAMDGTWYRAGEHDESRRIDTSEESHALIPSLGILSAEVGKSIDRVLIGEEIEVVFIAMHGAYGEDGTIQGLLDAFGVRYSGSGLCASALAMDKIRSRHMFMRHRLKVPRWTHSNRDRWDRDSGRLLEMLEEGFKFPCVVKPNNLGSSIGVFVVENHDHLEPAVDEVLRMADEVIVEEFLEGKEITCSVLEHPGTNGRLQALPVVEIVPHRPFFDYSAKYDPELAEEIVPARISEEAEVAAKKAALTAHRALGCSGFSRTDMILVGDVPYILETNTIPGLTPVSLFPKAAAAAGFDFSELLDILVDCALDKSPK